MEGRKLADLETDVAILGAGTAGLAAERKARSDGARTLLIDPHFAGTTCATVGCMPSKLLIAAGEAAHRVREAGRFGVKVSAPQIDGPAVMARLRSHRDAFVSSVKSTYEALPEGTCVKARASFSGPDALSLDDGRTVSFRTTVIATGSEPVIPEPFRALGDIVLTNEDLFELQDLPHSIGVIGAGPLGLELAQALSRLGVRVEVFDMEDTLAGLAPGDVEQSLREPLQAEFPIHLGARPEPEQGESGAVLKWGDGKMANFSRLLVSAGRKPVLDGLELEKAGIETGEHGAPLFDRNTMQCGSSRLFIAGDVDNDLPVLHEASAEGTIAGANAASWPDVEPMRRKTRLQIMFTEPNFAMVGDIPEREDGHVCGRVDYGDQGRAKAMGRNQGICELYAERSTGKLTGALLVGPDIEHIAHLLAWSMERGATANGLLSNPFYHPTLEEGMKTALQEICRTLSLDKPGEVDEGALPGDRQT